MPLKNTQYDLIMRRYHRMQLDNLHTQRAHLTEAYEKIPELSALEDELVTLNARLTRQRITGNSADPSLRAQIDALRAKRGALLIQHGYPADYLEIHYHCPDCRDTGIVAGIKCHCFRQAAIDLLYAQSNLADILARENFDTLTLDYYSDTERHPRTQQTIRDYMAQVIDRCHSYVDHFEQEKGSMLFTGTTGVGKTFLSNCIARALMQRCYSVVYLTATDLFDLFSRDTFRYDDEASDEISQYILQSDLLIIDDLGTELTNSFTNAKLFYCINERLLRHLGTIISTNLSIQDLADIYTERVSSRIISNYQMIALYGADIRLSRKFDRKP